jgi:MSHA pilin protein MshC
MIMRYIRGNRGFTMVEVVVVLILLAILTPFVVSRFTTSNVELIAQADVLKSHLRYAQIKAMNDTVTWGITLTNPTTYSLFKTGVTPPPSNLPGDTSYNHTLTDGVTVTVTSGLPVGVTSITYSEWGIPVDGSGTALTSNVVLTLSKGSQSTALTITRNTGFIQ